MATPAPALAFVLLAAAAAAIALAPAAAAFYLPGIAPVDFEEGAEVLVLANKLSSTINHVPLDYYRLGFCRPDGLQDRKIRSAKHLNLGQVLVGEHAEPSPYRFNMMADLKCQKLCAVKYNEKQVDAFRDAVRDEYYVRLNVDNLPVVVKLTLAPDTTATDASFEEIQLLGYPIGFKDSAADNKTAKILLNNHLSFTVLVHRPKTYSAGNFDSSPDGKRVYRVVGVQVLPSSVSQKMKNNDPTGQVESCSGPPLEILPKNSPTVVWTYDVAFEESPIQWATRWDPLLEVPTAYKSVQWFSIINSSLISLFLAVVVAVILLRTVYLDFARYNALDTVEDLDEDTGWKLVHGDVFRSPPMLALLAILSGSGAQLIVVTALTCGFAMLGFLSPANRGGLLSAMVGLWVFSNSICGFASARLYSSLGGANKRLVILGSAFFLSTVMFSVFFSINATLFAIQSGAAVPFFSMVWLVMIWLGISIPLNVGGSLTGYKEKPYDYPCHTNHIPREVPDSNEWLNIGITLLAGAQPFTVVFMQLIFILNSFWQNSFFYMFGFLFVTFLLLIVSSVEVGIVVTYVTLNREDYRWWWRSFLTTASGGVYVLLYAVQYAAKANGKQGIHLASTILYFGYTCLASFCFALVCGTLGFYASLWFVFKMYSAIRVD